MSARDLLGARVPLPGVPGVDHLRLAHLADAGGDLDTLPVTVKVLLENLLRHADRPWVDAADAVALARWDGRPVEHDAERAFMPARVLLQDFTGVPAVVDL